MKNKNKTEQKAPALLRNSLVAGIMMAGALQIAHAGVTPIGAGSIANQANPDGYTCSIDYGVWVHNAGVVEPAIAGCDEVYGAIGTPVPLYPQLTGPAAQKPTMTHRWWGSVSFIGEMPVNDVAKAGFITPDPITAKISDRGFRMLGIPGGLKYENGNSVIYSVPDPFNEVFDGLAIANSQFNKMDAYLYDYSDGSVTVEWQNNGTSIMRATFVHGSPYAFVDVLQGNLVLKSKAQDGPEKQVYHQHENQLGLWTDVAGNRSTYLVVGEGATTYSQVESNTITANNTTGRYTVALMPVGDELPDQTMINDFANYALNRVDEVFIDYDVDSQTQDVTISHQYLFQGQPVETMVGLMPLHWKNLNTPVSTDYKVRSARGVVKFNAMDSFTYELPFVGVLPTMPALENSYDVAKLEELIQDFIDQGEENWNEKTDTYWAGKNYGKIAELAALAHQHGFTQQHSQLVNWLKAELEEWLTAEKNGELAVTKYFSYDENWSTVLGYDESFGAQQQLNDHHFHYGYFIRAAAEICRVEKSWCAQDEWGGMIELLIRDYAADRNDPLFPYTRNFDPANGFSWASGHANFVLGNNNESTSEAANAYGAIILYGLITENQALTDHGIYLHTSSTATYWEYWNNLDRYRGLGGDYDNFHSDYDKMTTSIIWGSGMVFSTWFSPAYAHILGIQGLPLNPLVMHIGQHADYLKDYVTLGMKESGNGKPSGLPLDQWRDVWWNIWAMTDAQAAINDFNTMNFNYDIEAGETVAHTYQWIHAFNTLGQLRSGTGDITADYPAALVFSKADSLTYVAYNYSNAPRLVTFSDGMAIAIPANSFGIKYSGDMPDTLEPDTTPPTQPGVASVSLNLGTQVTLNWTASEDNVAVASYLISVSNEQGSQTLTSTTNSVVVSGLLPESNYQVSVVALDTSDNMSSASYGSFTTGEEIIDLPPTAPVNLTVSAITDSSATVTWSEATDDVGIENYHVMLMREGQLIGSYTTYSTEQILVGLTASSNYTVVVLAYDTAQQASIAVSVAFTTENPVIVCQDFCLEEQGNSLVVTAKVGQIVDMHFTINNGGQMNVRMIANGQGEHVYSINNLSAGDVINYSFTVIDGPAYGTPWQSHEFAAAPPIPDTEAPTQPGTPVVTNISHNGAVLNWASATDNIGVDHYEVTLNGAGFLTMTNSLAVSGLDAETSYDVSVVAVDAANNQSAASTTSFTTLEQPEVPECTDVCATQLNASTVRVTVLAGGIADIHYTVNNGAQQNLRMQVVDGQHQFDIGNLTTGATVRYFVTVIDGPAYDTAWFEITVQ